MPRSAVVVLGVLGVLVLFAAAVFAFADPSDPSDGDRAAGSASTPPAEPLSTAPTSTPGSDAGSGLDQQQLTRCVVPGGGDINAQVGSRDIPDAGVGRQIDQISDVVTDLRDLSFDQEPDPRFLGDDEIVERIEQDIRAEYDEQEADVDTRLLAALGAVPRGTDLLETQIDLLTSQVAGFYDPDTGELVVRTGDTDDGLDPTAQTVLAHELQHAVADQRLELPVDVTEDVTEGDAALAALSVIEGDATLTQQQFTVVGLEASEQVALLGDPDVAAAQEQLDDVPHYIARSLEFPYLAGLEFVCARYLDDGWDAVDATYDALPVTTAEILDPSRYPAEPADPRDPGDPAGDWTRARSTTLGAADLLWLFEAPGNDTGQALDDARVRALEWTGGELQLWTSADDTAVGVALTQQQPDGPLCDAVATWYDRAFPGGTDAPPRNDERLVRLADEQTAVVTCSGPEVRLGIAPDLETARSLAG